MRARARARAGRVAAQTRPRRAALSARHQIGNKTLTGLPVSCSGPWTRAPARNGMGAVNSPAPPLPCPDATYHSARPPGAAARPGRVRRALSLGRKRNRVDGRRALTRRLLCGEQQAARPGRAQSRGGPGGGGGGICPTPEPGSEGDTECRLESSRRGPRSQQSWGRRRCPGPRASTIVCALGSPLAPPPMFSAPHPACLPPRESAEGAADAGSNCWMTGGPEFRGGRRVGEGTGNYSGGQKGPGGSVGGGNGEEATEAGEDEMTEGAASETQTWPSLGTLLPGTQCRSDFCSLAHAHSELAHKVAGGGGAALALPLPASLPPRPIPSPPSFPPLSPSLG